VFVVRLAVPARETVQYSNHLDWHFRQNRRDTEGARRAQSRRWYLDHANWLAYEEMAEGEEREDALGLDQPEVQDAEDDAELLESLCSAPVGKTDADNKCQVCGETLRQFYHEESEEWHLRDCIRVEGKAYHPGCFEDHKTTLLLQSVRQDSTSSLDTSVDTSAAELPTPAEDIPNPMEGVETAAETAEAAVKVEAAEAAVKVEAADAAVKPETADTAVKVEAADAAVKIETADSAVKVETADAAVEPEAADAAVEPETADAAVKSETAEPETADAGVERETVETGVNLETTVSDVNHETADAAVKVETADAAVKVEAADSAVEPETADTAVQPETVDPEVKPETVETLSSVEKDTMAPDSTVGDSGREEAAADAGAAEVDVLPLQLKQEPSEVAWSEGQSAVKVEPRSPSPAPPASQDSYNEAQSLADSGLAHSSSEEPSMTAEGPSEPPIAAKSTEEPATASLGPVNSFVTVADTNEPTVAGESSTAVSVGSEEPAAAAESVSSEEPPAQTPVDGVTAVEAPPEGAPTELPAVKTEPASPQSPPPGSQGSHDQAPPSLTDSGLAESESARAVSEELPLSVKAPETSVEPATAAVGKKQLSASAVSPREPSSVASVAVSVGSQESAAAAGGVSAEEAPAQSLMDGNIAVPESRPVLGGRIRLRLAGQAPEPEGPVFSERPQPASVKPALVGRQLTEIPTKRRGDDESAFCVVM